MTEQEIEQNKAKRITIEKALGEAFHAGLEYAYDEEEPEIHVKPSRVVEALMARINLE